MTYSTTGDRPTCFPALTIILYMHVRGRRLLPPTWISSVQSFEITIHRSALSRLPLALAGALISLIDLPQFHMMLGTRNPSRPFLSKTRPTSYVVSISLENYIKQFVPRDREVTPSSVGTAPCTKFAMATSRSPAEIRCRTDKLSVCRPCNIDFQAEFSAHRVPLGVKAFTRSTESNMPRYIPRNQGVARPWICLWHLCTGWS